MIGTPACAWCQDPFGGDAFGNAAAETGGDPFGSGQIDPFATEAGNSAFSTPDSMAPGSDASLPDGGPSPNAAGADASKTARETELDPIVRLLRQRPPETPEQVGDGLTWLTRVQRWDEVGRLLDLVASKNWPLQSKAELARHGGTALWVRLRGDEAALSESQKQLVGEILRAPSQLARQPEWIDRWIDQLGSEKPSERRLAQFRLQDAGSQAILRLVSRLLDGDQKVDPEMLAGTATLFDESGIDALRMACTVQDPQRAARVLLAMAGLPGKHFTAELAAGLESTGLSAEDQQKLAQKLEDKFGGLPGRQAIDKYLAEQLQRRRENYFHSRMESSQVPQVVWQVTPDGSLVEAIEASKSQRDLELLAQLASMRMQMRSADRGQLIEDLSYVLQRDYQQSPDELRAASLKPVGEALGGVGATDLWQQVFEQATEWQMHGAAVQAIHALAESTSPDNPPLNFVSDLLHDPRPVVRYAALELLNRWDPDRNYRGSEQALRTAFEMRSLGAGPHALVIGQRADLSQAAQQQIQQLTSSDVSVAHSAKTTLKVLNGWSPVELILIVDRVTDQSLFELLQRIRNSAKGRSLPIAVLTDELYSHERQWIAQDGGSFTSVLSRNLEQMQRIYDNLLGQLDTHPMTTAERARFAKIGAQFLARIAGDRTRYAFYPIQDYRTQLISASLESTAEERIQILSSLGDAESQLRLVELAASDQLPQEERILAANAFADSVRQFGNQLGQPGIVQSYAWYNEYGPKDRTAVRVLGHVLDVIEANSGKREWPEKL